MSNKEDLNFLIINFSRKKDCFGNATALCKYKNKNFNDWLNLEQTQELINYLEKQNLIV